MMDKDDRYFLWLFIAFALTLLLIARIGRGAELDCIGWRAGSGPCHNSVCPTEPQAKSQYANVVRIQVSERSGYSWGSGTIVAAENGKAYVVTAWHLFRDHVAGPIVVHVPGHGGYYADLLQTDPTWDVAALAIADPGVTPARVAETAPEVGEQLRAGGFGQNGSFQWFSGRVLPFVGPARGAPFEFLNVAVVVRQGDSGGPIANSNNVMVGVICGSDGRRVVGACFPRIRRLLAGVIPPWRRRPVVVVRPPVPPSPPAPQQDPQPPLVAVVRNTQAIAALTVRLGVLEARPPVPGHQGLPGETGLPGPPGEIDQIWLNKLISQRIGEALDALPPGEQGLQGEPGEGFDSTEPLFYVRKIHMDTGEEIVEPMYPGDELTIRLFPPE